MTHLLPRTRVKLYFVAIAVALLGGQSAQAATGTWLNTGDTNSNWNTSSNWTGGVIPGSTAAITGTNANPDIALFNTAVRNYGASAASPIVIDSASENMLGISFDTLAGSYFIGSTAGNPLYVSSGGAIQILSTLTAVNAVETINAPIVIEGANGTYTFANNSANGTAAGAGTLNFGGGITGGAPGATVLTLAGTNTNANTISGILDNGLATTLAITKSDAGTWVLSGANTYTGTTTISGGSLQLGSGGTIGSLSTSSTITDNGNLTINRSNAVAQGTDFSGSAISGSGSFTQAGSGTTTLNAANTYSGATAISAGALTLSGASGSIANSSSVSISGTLNLNYTAGNTNRIGDSAGVTLNPGGAVTMTGNTTTNSTENVGLLTLGGGQSSITLTSASSRITTFNATGISRTNNSTLLVRGATLGSQATNVGRVTFSSTSGLTQIGTNTANGTTPGSTTNLKIIPWIVGDTAAAGTGTNFATYDTTSGLRPLGTNETVTFANQTASDQNVKDTTVAGTTVNFTGNTTANSIALAPAAAAASPSPAPTSVTYNGTTGATLNSTSGALGLFNFLNVTLQNFDSINLGTAANPEGIIYNSSGGLTINSPINPGTNFALTISGGSAGKVVTLGGANTYTGALTVNGVGTVQLNGTNTMSSITINGGVLIPFAAGSLGPSTVGITVNPTGTLTFGNNGVGNNFGGGTITLAGGGITAGSNGSFSNAINVTANSTINPLSGNDSGAISSSNSSVILSVNETSTGTFSGSLGGFTGTFNFSGTTSTNGIKLAGSATNAGSAAFDLGAGTAVLQSQPTVTNTTYQLGSLAGASGTSLKGSTASNMAVTYQIGGRNADTTFAGAIQNGTGTSSTTSISKVGTGTQTLSGASTYTGTTTVTGGTLELDNNNTTTARLANTSGITVNSGGTLLLAQTGSAASNDRINDTATLKLNGGVFNTLGLSEHGASNNTAGVGALTLQSSSIIDLGNGSSILAIANSKTATWNGILSIYNWSGTPTTGNGTDQLYFGNDSTGLTTAQLAEIIFYSDAGTTQLGSASILSTGEVVAAIPEPQTWAMMVGGLGTLILLQRRNRRAS